MKDFRHICALGLMSGTSLDGIDVSLLCMDGDRITSRGTDSHFPFSDEDRQCIRLGVDVALRTDWRHLGRDWRCDVLRDVEERVTQLHIAAIESFCRCHGVDIGSFDVIGFHGQTVFHDASIGVTVQLGFGDSVSDYFGCPVVYDFRASDVALGGEGAPLAPIYHRFLAREVGIYPLVFLNIGGVSNVSWISASGDVVAFDTGPGNGLLDDWVMRHTSSVMDRDGFLSSKGRVHEGYMDRLMSHDYFSRPPPKSLDRHDFSDYAQRILASGDMRLSAADGAALLAYFTAFSICRGTDFFPLPAHLWVVCGGGRHNPVMMGYLSDLLGGVAVVPSEDYGIAGDFVESTAFAYFAIRRLRGEVLTYPSLTGCSFASLGGTVVGLDV